MIEFCVGEYKELHDSVAAQIVKNCTNNTPYVFLKSRENRGVIVCRGEHCEDSVSSYGGWVAFERDRIVFYEDLGLLIEELKISGVQGTCDLITFT